jgi:hypothetical protein
MSEVLVEFETVLRDDEGRWRPRVCARQREDALWEGWLEFIPVGESGDAVRTTRETEQHDREGVLYWAEGLTAIYLEGALIRALARRPRQHPESDRPDAPTKA